MTWAKCIILATVATVATWAQASTTPVTPPQVPELYGGGSTLAAVALVGTNWLNVDPSTGVAGTEQRLSTTNATLNGSTTAYGSSVSKNSLIGSWVASANKTTPNPSVQYCQAGSYTARYIIEGQPSRDAWLSCGDYVTNSHGSPSGFGTPALAAVSGQPAITATSGSTGAAYAGDVDANFGAGELPITTYGYNEFFLAGDTGIARSTTHTAPVQIPVLASSIGILYNASGSGLSNSPSLVLTESQICQIFAGQITDWKQLGAPNSLPIKLAIRSDSNGTTYYFSNHLSGVCPSAAGTPVSGNFITSTGFTTADPLIANGGANASANTTFIFGNIGVVATILATPGAIGFGELADALARATAAGASLGYADIKIAADTAASKSYGPVTSTCSATTGPASKTCKLTNHPAVKFKVWDPLKNLPKTFAVNVYANELLTSSLSDYVTVDSNGRPQYTSVSQAYYNTLHANPCLLGVHPNDVMTAPLTAKAPYDYTQYPLVAITNLLGYNTGNENATPYIRSLFAAALANVKATTVGAKTGYSLLKPTLMSTDSTVTGYAPPAAATLTGVVDACINP